MENYRVEKKAAASYCSMRMPVCVCECPGAMDQFIEAKGQLSTLKKDPSNDVKLKIYALFKQVSTPPGALRLHSQSCKSL